MSVSSVSDHESSSAKVFVELERCDTNVSEESKNSECPSIFSLTHTEDYEDAEPSLAEREDNREVAHGI